MNNLKSFEECTEDKEISLLLFQSIYKLKKKYKDVLTYRIYFELSFSQIGSILEISENTAKVIYFRGKEILKKQWEGAHKINMFQKCILTLTDKLH
jgi:RNA polymerase sigma-70 factor (ECF subfamily)